MFFVWFICVIEMFFDICEFGFTLMTFDEFLERNFVDSFFFLTNLEIHPNSSYLNLFTISWNFCLKFW